MSVIDNLLGWDKLSWPKRILIGIPIAAAVIGWMYYDRNQEAKAMHTEMVAMCGDDTACVAAVNQHAEICFKENYSMSKRRSGVRTAEFVGCVNEKSGAEHFVVEKD